MNAFYRGKGVPGEEGFEMEEFEGMYVSPSGKYWGSEPMSEEQEKELERNLLWSNTETRRERRQRERLNKKNNQT